MKMMIQADDYGITMAVTDGILACAREGVMTQTGLFANMPWAKYAVDRMKEFPNVLLGIDLNVSTGSPITDPHLIPTLVQENGDFLTSNMHKELDKRNLHHVSYEDAFLEYENQMKNFIKLAGRKPGYLGGHAWGSQETNQALRDIAEKYDVFNVESQPGFSLEGDFEQNWARPIRRANGSYEFSIMSQYENDPLTMFKEGKLNQLEEALNSNEVFMLHTHAGYLDRTLLQLSSWNLLRPMEAGFLMSKEFKTWLRDHDVELVNYLDIYK